MLCIGEKIRRARLEAGFTQENLAERIGLSRTAIARYEAGDIEPRIKNLIAISKELNVSVDELFGLKEISTECELDLSEKELLALKIFIKEIRKK